MEEMLTMCAHLHKLISLSDQEKQSIQEKSQQQQQRGTSLRHRLSLVGSSAKVERKKVAYIHCKAGLSRSYVFLICYLMSQLLKPFEECEAYLKTLREFDPKPEHTAFVAQFAQYLLQPRVNNDRTDDEDKYVRILADVLSLPQKYRLKLLQDLEKLT